MKQILSLQPKPISQEKTKLFNTYLNIYGLLEKGNSTAAIAMLWQTPLLLSQLYRESLSDSDIAYYLDQIVSECQKLSLSDQDFQDIFPEYKEYVFLQKVKENLFKLLDPQAAEDHPFRIEAALKEWQLYYQHTNPLHQQNIIHALTAFKNDAKSGKNLKGSSAYLHYFLECSFYYTLRLFYVAPLSSLSDYLKAARNFLHEDKTLLIHIVETMNSTKGHHQLLLALLRHTTDLDEIICQTSEQKTVLDFVTDKDAITHLLACLDEKTVHRLLVREDRHGDTGSTGIEAWVRHTKKHGPMLLQLLQTYKPLFLKEYEVFNKAISKETLAIDQAEANVVYLLWKFAVCHNNLGVLTFCASVLPLPIGMIRMLCAQAQTFGHTLSTSASLSLVTAIYEKTEQAKASALANKEKPAKKLAVSTPKPQAPIPSPQSLELQQQKERLYNSLQALVGITVRQEQDGFVLSFPKEIAPSYIQKLLKQHTQLKSTIHPSKTSDKAEIFIATAQLKSIKNLAFNTLPTTLLENARSLQQQAEAEKKAKEAQAEKEKAEKERLLEAKRAQEEAKKKEESAKILSNVHGPASSGFTSSNIATSSTKNEKKESLDKGEKREKLKKLIEEENRKLSEKEAELKQEKKKQKKKKGKTDAKSTPRMLEIEQAIFEIKTTIQGYETELLPLRPEMPKEPPIEKKPASKTFRSTPLPEARTLDYKPTHHSPTKPVIQHLLEEVKVAVLFIEQLQCIQENTETKLLTLHGALVRAVTCLFSAYEEATHKQSKHLLLSTYQADDIRIFRNRAIRIGLLKNGDEQPKSKEELNERDLLHACLKQLPNAEQIDAFIANHTIEKPTQITLFAPRIPRKTPEEYYLLIQQSVLAIQALASKHQPNGQSVIKSIKQTGFVSLTYDIAAHMATLSACYEKLILRTKPQNALNNNNSDTQKGVISEENITQGHPLFGIKQVQHTLRNKLLHPRNSLKNDGLGKVIGSVTAPEIYKLCADHIAPIALPATLEEATTLAQITAPTPHAALPHSNRSYQVIPSAKTPSPEEVLFSQMLASLKDAARRETGMKSLAACLKKMTPDMLERQIIHRDLTAYKDDFLSFHQAADTLSSQHATIKALAQKIFTSSKQEQWVA